MREKFTCRDCEAITEPPAPSHPIARGFAGPSLLAMILVAKFLLHQPLNRQSATYAREGVEIDTSTLADWVGGCVITLDPILASLKAHVLRGERIHADDTTVPMLAKGKTATGRLWTYVRDDRPFGGKEPPAAFFEYSRNRAGVHPQKHLAGWTGIMQADAYNGYNALYEAAWKPAPIKEAACWAHRRRKLFDHAKSGRAPIAVEAVRRMDEIFACERTITDQPPDERAVVRSKVIAPLAAELRSWLTEQRAKLSATTDLAKDINYGLSQWVAFTREHPQRRISDPQRRAGRVRPRLHARRSGAALFQRRPPRPRAGGLVSALVGLSPLLPQPPPAIGGLRLARRGPPLQGIVACLTEPFLEHVLHDRQGRKDVGPADIKRELGDGFRRLRLGQSVIHGAVEVIGNLGDLAGRDERADCDEATIAGREIGPEPKVTKQNVGGVLDDARQHRAELFLNMRRALRFGGLVERQRLWDDGGKLVGSDFARGEDVLGDSHRGKSVSPAGIEGEMGDDLGNLGGLHAIVERQIHVESHFGRLVGRDQGGEGVLTG